MFNGTVYFFKHLRHACTTYTRVITHLQPPQPRLNCTFTVAVVVYCTTQLVPTLLLSKSYKTTVSYFTYKHISPLNHKLPHCANYGLQFDYPRIMHPIN